MTCSKGSRQDAIRQTAQHLTKPRVLQGTSCSRSAATCSAAVTLAAACVSSDAALLNTHATGSSSSGGGDSSSSSSSSSSNGRQDTVAAAAAMWTQNSPPWRLLPMRGRNKRAYTNVNVPPSPQASKASSTEQRAPSFHSVRRSSTSPCQLLRHVFDILPGHGSCRSYIPRRTGGTHTTSRSRSHAQDTGDGIATLRRSTATNQKFAGCKRVGEQSRPSMTTISAGAYLTDDPSHGCPAVVCWRIYYNIN